MVILPDNSEAAWCYFAIRGRNYVENRKFPSGRKGLHLEKIYGKIRYITKEGGVPMQTMPSRETMDQIGDLFKGFADSTRVQILFLLARQELCVTDIAEAVDLSQSAISHQLRLLKQMHLIKFRREGKNILYSLADDHVKTILEMGLEHVLE